MINCALDISTCRCVKVCEKYFDWLARKRWKRKIKGKESEIEEKKFDQLDCAKFLRDIWLNLDVPCLVAEKLKETR